jgi:hypothetical protein
VIILVFKIFFTKIILNNFNILILKIKKKNTAFLNEKQTIPKENLDLSKSIKEDSMLQGPLYLLKATILAVNQLPLS